MEAYLHRVQYYETDQMGVVHHSNYIRWFEEARTAVMGDAGVGYDEVERRGYLSPVLSAQCRYLQSMRFGEIAEIRLKMHRSKGVRFSFEYEVRDHTTGELRAAGETTHCFMRRDGKVIKLEREDPELDARLRAVFPEE